VFRVLAINNPPVRSWGLFFGDLTMPEDKALKFLQNIQRQAENPGDDPLTEDAGVIEDKNLSIPWEITYYVNPAVRVVKIGPLEQRTEEG
jgi:hypothetical protein